MNSITHIPVGIHDYVSRKHLELTYGNAQFHNEILHATWSSITGIRFIFGPMLSILGGKTH